MHKRKKLIRALWPAIGSIVLFLIALSFQQDFIFKNLANKEKTFFIFFSLDSAITLLIIAICITLWAVLSKNKEPIIWDRYSDAQWQDTEFPYGKKYW